MVKDGEHYRYSTRMDVGINNLLARFSRSDSTKSRLKKQFSQPNLENLGYTAWPSRPNTPPEDAHSAADTLSSPSSPTSILRNETPHLEPLGQIGASRNANPRQSIVPPNIGLPSRPKLDGVGRISDPSNLSTVQESCTLESPSEPASGHVHMRTNSFPKDTSRRGSEVDGPNPSPRRGPHSPVFVESPHANLEEAMERSISRASSMVLPHHLTPLLIPSPKDFSTIPRPPIPASSEIPPEVPPKSPRHIGRPSRKPKSKKSAPSASGSTPTLRTSASSLTSINFSPDPQNSSARADSPSSFNAPSEMEIERPAGKLGIKIQGSNPFKHQKGAKSMDDRDLPRLKISLSNNRLIGSARRRSSEESSNSRGRSATRNKTGRNYSVSHPMLRDLSPPHDFTVIPHGLKVQNANHTLSNPEITALKRMASEQAEQFEILKLGDVEALSEELRLLDQRCEYLKRTQASLRHGRRSLHSRVITSLKAPKSTKSSREMILKHGEALAALDQSLDEWEAKLEQAENRRTQIRQKLLEHIAAASALNMPSGLISEHTPPRSPQETNRSVDRERRDVESIQIFADSSVTELLESIEREMHNVGADF